MTKPTFWWWFFAVGAFAICVLSLIGVLEWPQVDTLLIATLVAVACEEIRAVRRDISALAGKDGGK